VFLEKIFSRVFFLRIFLSRYSCVYKKRVFAFFPNDFIPSFLLAIFVFQQKNFSRVFPPIFCHDIRVFIKNVFSHFFVTIFSNIFWLPYSCDFGKFFLAFFPPVLWSRYSCVKKTRFRTFPDDFFPSFFGRDIRVSGKKFFSRFFPILWSRHSCVYKKHVFELFPEDFFHLFCLR